MKRMLAAGGMLLAVSLNSFAAENSMLTAKMVDLDAHAVPGVKLFLYSNPDTRRPADFISANSDQEGRVRITVPAGKYWVVAREKKDGTYGPLARGDRHSGEPTELELVEGKELESTFTVADIQEVKERKRLASTDLVRVTGRILDQKGTPVSNAYVMARMKKENGPLPEYLSAWTEEDGVFQMYLPAGRHYLLCASVDFPPSKESQAVHELVTEPGKVDIAIDIQLPVE